MGRGGHSAKHRKPLLTTPKTSRANRAGDSAAGRVGSPPEPILISQAGGCAADKARPGRGAVVNPNVALPFVSFAMAVSKAKGSAVVIVNVHVINSVWA